MIKTKTIISNSSP